MQPLSLFICREEEFTAEELAPSRTRPGSLDRGTLTLPQRSGAHTRHTAPPDVPCGDDNLRNQGQVWVNLSLVPCWPLHDIAITNIVWCMPHKGGSVVGRMLRNWNSIGVQSYCDRV